MSNDIVTLEQAYEIDRATYNAGYPDDALRIVGYRISGNRTRSFLEIPGNDAAPRYEYRTGEHGNAHYEHVSGCTLAEWNLEGFQNWALAMQAEYADHAETERTLRQF